MSAQVMVRRGVKVAALPFGARRRARPGDLVILLYHRLGAGAGEIELPPALFERQLRALATSFPVVRLDEGVDRGGVVVTFDDGTADFAELALPLLVQHAVPALLYVATSWIDRDRESLSWSAIREAVSTGLVEIGSHTRDHADLRLADRAEADEQLRASKETIEDRLGLPCAHVAFPWAVASGAARAVARELYATAAVEAWRVNRAERIDPFDLGRTPILRSDGMAFFGAKARGLLEHERVAYRLLRRGPWRIG